MVCVKAFGLVIALLAIVQRVVGQFETTCAEKMYTCCDADTMRCSSDFNSCYCDQICFYLEDCCSDILDICSPPVPLAITYLAFLTLGTTSGVSTVSLPSLDDGASDAIPITEPFPFGAFYHTSVYVNNDGVFVFGRNYTGFTFGFPPLGTRFVVFPFWYFGDISRGVGSVRYEVHTGTTNFITSVSNFISSERGTQFVGTWMLLVEWNNIPIAEYIDPDGSLSETNTFQAAIITSGTESYALYTYQCGSMDWPGRARVGFNADDTLQTYGHHRLSGNFRVNEIACLNSPTTDWNNVVYRLGRSADVITVDAPTIVLVMFHSSTSVWFIWEPQDEVDVYEFTYQYNIKESEQVYCNVSDPVTVTINGTIQYLLTGMEEYSVYTVSIVAVVIGEEQAAEARSSSTVREVTTIQAAPSAGPQGLRATAAIGTVTVEWDPVDCVDRNSDITGYVLRYGEASSDQREEVMVPGDAGRMYIITGLASQTVYYIGVAANTSDYTGPYSGITVETPEYPPNAPSLENGGVTSTTIRLTWEGQASVDNYTIVYERVTGGQQVLCPDVSHTGMVTVDGSSTEYTVGSLQEYSTYSIAVTAVNTAGENTSVITATTLQAAPSAGPQGLRATAAIGTVTVEWDPVDCADRNSEITGYVLRYGEASSDQREEVMVSGDVGRMYIITGLASQTVYYIGVAAVTDDFTGPYANITVETPEYPPNAPSLENGGVTSTTIRLTWEGQASVDNYMIVFERVTGGQQVLCPDVSHTGMETVDGSSTEYTVGSLQEYSTYSIAVTAVNTAGEDTSVITATTLQAGPTGVPQNVMVAEVNSRNVTVQWSSVNCIDRNSEITGYVLRYGEASSDQREEQMISGSENGDEMFTFVGLVPYTEYSMEVAATNSNGDIGPFGAIAVETLQDKPGPVSSLSSTPYQTSIELTWSAPLLPNGVITAYEVSHQQFGDVELERMNDTDVLSMTITLIGLKPQTTYILTVRAYTISGPGPESSVTETTETIPQVEGVEIEVLDESSSVLVSWTAVPVLDIAGYYIVYYSPTDAPTDVKNVTSSVTIVVITGLSSGQYQFQVQAVVEIGGEVFQGERSPVTSLPDTTTSDQSESSSSVAPIAVSVAVVALLVLAVAVAAVLIVWVILRRRRLNKADPLSATNKHSIPMVEVNKFAGIPTVECTAYGMATLRQSKGMEALPEQPQEYEISMSRGPAYGVANVRQSRGRKPDQPQEYEISMSQGPSYGVANVRQSRGRKPDQPQEYEISMSRGPAYGVASLRQSPGQEYEVPMTQGLAYGARFPQSAPRPQPTNNGPLYEELQLPASYSDSDSESL